MSNHELHEAIMNHAKEWDAILRNAWEDAEAAWSEEERLDALRRAGLAYGRRAHYRKLAASLRNF